MGGMILVVHFRHGRQPHNHAVASEREAQDTIAGWRREGGMWLVNTENGRRAWVPWHTVDEVSLPAPPGMSMAARRPAGVIRKPAVAKAAPPTGGTKQQESAA